MNMAGEFEYIAWLRQQQKALAPHVVSVALPKGAGTRGLAEELYFGMKEMADRFDVAIVGGDTNTWTGPLVISVTVFGDVTERGYVTRGGAQPGDWLFVT